MLAVRRRDNALLDTGNIEARRRRTLWVGEIGEAALKQERGDRHERIDRRHAEHELHDELHAVTDRYGGRPCP